MKNKYKLYKKYLYIVTSFESDWWVIGALWFSKKNTNICQVIVIGKLYLQFLLIFFLCQPALSSYRARYSAVTLFYFYNPKNSSLITISGKKEK